MGLANKFQPTVHCAFIEHRVCLPLPLQVNSLSLPSSLSVAVSVVVYLEICIFGIQSDRSLIFHAGLQSSLLYPSSSPPDQVNVTIWFLFIEARQQLVNPKRGSFDNCFNPNWSLVGSRLGVQAIPLFDCCTQGNNN